MKFWCKYWYKLGLIPAVISAILLIINWNNMSILTRVSTINFVGIMIHQFEEYGFPGGAPVFFNKYVGGGDERFPLNQFSAMITNVLIAYICYILPIFFPNTIWLGLAPMIFGCVFQVIMHLGLFLVKFHHFYNPGLGAVLCIHVPCGIYYIYYVITNGLVSTSIWIYTVIYLIAMIFVTVLLGQKVFSSEHSKYVFSTAEIEAGDKLASRLGVK